MTRQQQALLRSVGEVQLACCTEAVLRGRWAFAAVLLLAFGASASAVRTTLSRSWNASYAWPTRSWYSALLSGGFHLSSAKALSQSVCKDLRPSTATLLLVQGVPPRVVMEILGHSQISTTQNTYQHVIPDLHREAAARIDAIFS